MDHQNYAELVGIAAAAASLYAANSRTIIPLRIAAIVANVLAMIYSSLHGTYPTFVLNAVLLPLNAWRLHGMVKLIRDIGAAARGDLNADWLLRAEPLSSWLARHGDWPLVGELLGARSTAFAMSWAGALFDLSIVPLLLWRKSRRFAFAALVTFHLLTAALFSIGMFPYLMIAGATLFFEPDWPRKLAPWAERLLAQPTASAAQGVGLRTPRWLQPALVAYFVVQLLLPARHWLYPGQLCWSEQGFRFSWNVMLMEKNGAVDFRVVEPSTGRTFRVSPSDYFTPYQTAMMSTQPDMVLEAARTVAADYRKRGLVEPAVYVDAFASLNGRAMQRLLDPTVDLAREVDGLSNKTWILPMTTEPSSRVASMAGSLP